MFSWGFHGVTGPPSSFQRSFRSACSTSNGHLNNCESPANVPEKKIMSIFPPPPFCTTINTTRTRYLVDYINRYGVDRYFVSRYQYRTVTTYSSSSGCSDSSSGDYRDCHQARFNGTIRKLYCNYPAKCMNTRYFFCSQL